MKLLIRSICAVVLSGLIVIAVQAGVRDVGNPGNGVVVNGKLLLLDLYEAGVLNPHIDRSVVPETVYLERAQRLSFLSQQDARLLAIKLTEIRALSPFLADSMAVALNLYVWTLLDQKLVDIPDASPVVLPSRSIMLANRLGGFIRLNRDAWQILSSENRIALVMHETLMALSPSIFRRSVTTPTDTFRVRQIVGYLFMPELKSRRAEGFAVFSGIPHTLSKITNENSILTVLDVLAIENTVTGKVFFNVLGTHNVFAKETFCDNLLSKAKGTEVMVSYLYRTTAVTYRFETFETQTGFQNGLEQDSSRSHMALEMPLGNYQILPNATPQCLELLEQNAERVRKVFTY